MGSWMLSWGRRFGLDVMLAITLGFKTLQEKSLQLEGSSGTISRDTGKYHDVLGRTRKTNSQPEALVGTPFISAHITFLICQTETWEQFTCVLPIGEMAAPPPDCTTLCSRPSSVRSEILLHDVNDGSSCDVPLVRSSCSPGQPDWVQPQNGFPRRQPSKFCSKEAARG